MLFYVSMSLIVSGYMIPCNMLSESASLIMIRVASTVPYLGPVLGEALIFYLIDENYFDFRFAFLFHALIAFNFVILSIVHNIITHKYGSRTVEKANTVNICNF